MAGIAVLACLVAWSASAQDERTPALDCEPAPREVTVDGRLDEWDTLTEHELVEDVDGLSSTVATVRWCHSLDGFYLAVVLDDESRLATELPGAIDGALQVDALEIAVAVEPPATDGDPDGPAPLRWNRFLLWPYGDAPRWSLVEWRGRPDPVGAVASGVELATRISEADDRATCEIRLPFALLGLRPDADRSLRFQCTVIDADLITEPGALEDVEADDGVSVRRVTLGGPAVREGEEVQTRLRLVGTPPNFGKERSREGGRSVWVAVLAVLAVVTLLAFVGSSSLKVYQVLQPRVRHLRWMGCVVVAGVAAGLWWAPDWIESHRRGAARAELEERVTRLQDAFQVLRRDAEFARRMRGIEAPMLCDVLEGRGYRTPGVYAFQSIPVAPADPTFVFASRSGGVPFLEHGLLFDEASADASGNESLGRQLTVRFDEPFPATYVHLAVAAWLPDGVAMWDDALQVDFVFSEGPRASGTFPLWDTEATVDDAVRRVADCRGGFRPPFTDARLATEAGARPIRTVDHLVFEVPDLMHSESDAELVSLTLRMRSGGEAWLSGVTVERGLSKVEYEPLRFGSRDADGFPFALQAGLEARGVLRVLEGERRTIDLSAIEQPEQLRLYFQAEERPFFAGEVLEEGRARAQIEMEVEGRDEPLVVPLRTSLEIPDLIPASGRIPDSFGSFVASSYPTRAGLRHYLGFELPLDDVQGAVRQLTVHVPDDAGGAFVVAAVTAAVKSQPAAPPADAHFADRGGSVFLDEAIVEQFRDSSLTVAVLRDGRIQALGRETEATLAERLLGAPVRPEQIPEAGEAGEVVDVPRAGRDFLSVVLPFPLEDAEFQVLLLREVVGQSELLRKRDLAALGFGALSLPLALVLLVDWLTRMTRIRSRLSLLFLVISAAPLTVMFLIVVKLIVSEHEASERQRSEELVQGVARHLGDLVDRADEFADAVHRSLVDDARWLDPKTEPEVLQTSLARIASEFPVAGADVEVRVAISANEGGVETTRFHYSSPRGREDLRWSAADGLSLVRGRVVFAGGGEGGAIAVQVAGFVQRDSIDALGLVAAEHESVSLLSPRLQVGELDAPVESIEGGILLAGTRIGDAVDTSEAAAVARELDDGSGMVVRRATGTRVYDLLRDDSGDPVTIVRSQVVTDALRVDLGFAQVDLLWLALLLGAGTLACALFLGSVVTEGITRPLDRLQAGARALASGEETVAVRASGDDEVAELADSFNRMSAELRRRIRDQETLSVASRSLTQSLQLGDRTQVAMGMLAELVQSDRLACYLYDPGAEELRLEGAWLEGAAGTPPSPRIAPPTPLLARALAEHAPQWSPASDVQGVVPPEERALRDVDGLLVLPLGRSGRSTGVLTARVRGDGDPLDDLDGAFLLNLLSHMSVAFENARLYRRAVEDPETGLYVSSYFRGRVGEEIDRGGSLTLVALRLRLTGDAAGDLEVRRRVALRMARELRRTCHDRELVARFGALEFTVLVPDGGAERGQEIRDRIVGRLGTLDGSLREVVTATVSSPDDGRNREALFEALAERLGAGRARRSTDEGAKAGVLARMSGRLPGIVFRSERWVPVLDQVERTAASDATLLVLGETGTGKEVIARLVHECSPRRLQPFVAVHCAALPHDLLEAELFGHEKGAFTGADRQRIGRFEAANGGTLFLDEIAEIPLSVQVKLLRVLQERKVQRVGSSEDVAVDVRVVAATHRTLEDAVRDGRFREDLYYRLRVVEVVLPALRERREEIPDLVERFLRDATPDGEAPAIEPSALDRLHLHDWPGNVRELRNVVQRAVVLGDGSIVRREDIDLGTAGEGRLERTSQSGERGVPEIGAFDGLTERQQGLVALLRERRRITSGDVLDVAGVSRRTALRDLQVLMARGLVVREGSRKAAVYRLRESV